MRVLLDEDVPIQALAVLRHLLPTHRVDHIHGLNWSGKKDKSVLADAARAGFDVIVTNDRNQLNDSNEMTAIKKSGFHHVTFRQRRRGLVGLGLALAAIVAAMPLIMQELESVDSQRLIAIKGLDPSLKSRFTMTDPRREPPKYWPR
ncbi:MAG TPA: DUF5615 family PIN-like protein [Kribbella sp.]|uniref:DUF5615 family PIN-like protein n=1 Tax=Kribbella sp. TaxID=1871183 RepID=UPI002D7A2534|nr:DUF5615 family PIN-like protein [Kribbella sp.]HET6293847.1 DUF5615 family PIN-like protein [Kribbella sp.]